MDGGYRNKARYIGTKMCGIEATAQSYSAASPARGGGVGDACFSHLPAKGVLHMPKIAALRGRVGERS
jgi:hypothetical protein